MSEEKAKRGGKRAGAGRKKADPHLVRVAVPLRLPAWLRDEVEKLPGPRSDVIEAALLKALKLRPPRAP